MKSPPVWTDRELDFERERAIEHFRQARLTEPLEIYTDTFDEYRNLVEEVFEQTANLAKLLDAAVDLLSDKRKLEVVRYLSGPPVSEDDLKILIQSQSLATSRSKSDPQLADRLVTFIQDWHDRRRFPWINESREPNKHDRKSAIIATATLLATRRLETMRRNQGKSEEALLTNQLRRARSKQVPARRVRVLSDAPQKGEFCTETMLGNRKADVLIGLHDGRTMAVECKLSNSATNSIKRLNNDATVKASFWKDEFGSSQLVPAAVLAGVYNLRNLKDAQDKGLTIFWSHDLTSMLNWMRNTED